MRKQTFLQCHSVRDSWQELWAGCTVMQEFRAQCLLTKCTDNIFQLCRRPLYVQKCIFCRNWKMIRTKHFQRFHLAYWYQSDHSHRNNYVFKVEQMQKMAGKIITGLVKNSFKWRLKECGFVWPTKMKIRGGCECFLEIRLGINCKEREEQLKDKVKWIWINQNH